MIVWHITALTMLPGHRLALRFADGLEGVVDLSQETFEGIFAPLKDEAYFAQATIREGAVVWPHGAEMAPDAMYDEVAALALMPKP